MNLTKRWHTKNILDVSSFFCLLIRCPLGKENKPDCPFCELRKCNNLEQKFDMAQTLANGSGTELMQRHKTCFYKGIRNFNRLTCQNNH